MSYQQWEAQFEEKKEMRIRYNLELKERGNINVETLKN